MRARALAACAALGLLLAGLAGPARAALPVGPEIGIQDDRILLEQPDRAPTVVAEWAALGVDTVRIFARWAAVAPGVTDATPPAGFEPANHLDPRYHWERLDNAVRLVRARGMSVMLTITGSGPLWGSSDPRRGNPRWKPDPPRFAQFATAVATRYAADVDRYLVWNEPNLPLWLQPQSTCRRRVCTPASPHLYRKLVQAAAPAVRAADPGAQIVIGELAPVGGGGASPNDKLRPLTFLRAMGCVNARYRPVRGGVCRGFKPLAADLFGYHPHAVLRAPDQPNPQPDDVQIADLPRLFSALDRLTRVKALRPRGARIPVYLTEFGYQTNPPDPFVGVSPALQARYLQQSAFIAWRQPRIKGMVQYVWEDEPVGSRGGGPRTYAGWQSGLLFESGKPKPALAVFPHPFFVERRPGRRLARFWGQVRPGGEHTVRLERRVRGSRTWRAVLSARTDARGYWSRLLQPRARSAYRFTYDAPDPAYDSGDSGESAIVTIPAARR